MPDNKIPADITDTLLSAVRESIARPALLKHMYHHLDEYTKEWDSVHRRCLKATIEHLFFIMPTLVMENYYGVMDCGMNPMYVETLANTFCAYRANPLNSNTAANLDVIALHLLDTVKEMGITMHRTVADDSVPKVDDTVNEQKTARAKFAHTATEAIIAAKSTSPFMDRTVDSEWCKVYQVCSDKCFIDIYHVDSTGREFSDEFMDYLYKLAMDCPACRPYTVTVGSVLEALVASGIPPFKPLTGQQREWFIDNIRSCIDSNVVYKCRYVVEKFVALLEKNDLAERYYGKVQYFGLNIDYFIGLVYWLTSDTIIGQDIDLDSAMGELDNAGVTIYGDTPLEEPLYKQDKDTDMSNTASDIIAAKHVTLMQMIQDRMSERTKGWSDVRANKLKAIIRAMGEHGYITHDHVKEVAERNINPEWINKIASKFEEMSCNPLNSLAKILKHPKKAADFLYREIEAGGTELANPEVEPVKEVDEEPVVDNDVSSMVNETLIELVQNDPNRLLYHGPIESDLRTLFHEKAGLLTHEQRYQLTCLVIENAFAPHECMCIGDFTSNHMIQRVAKRLTEQGLIDAIATKDTRLAYDASYIFYHFYDETRCYIPAEHHESYKDFVKRYLTIPYLFSGGYLYRSFNMKFGYLTALFFRALRSYNFDLEANVGEDSLTLSLIRYWKTNECQWKDGNGIIPRLERFEVQTLLNGVNVVTVRGEMKEEQDDCEGKVYTTCGIDETERKTTVYKEKTDD